MNDEQKKVFARLMRRHAKLMADMPALISLLETYELRNEPPIGWREKWEIIRQTDEYKGILEEFEPTISSLETSSDEADLIRLLQKISAGKLPN